MKATIFYSIIVLSVFSIVFISYNQQELLEQREVEMQFIMISHNRINHENAMLRERIDELQSANEALIKYSTPASCIKAIKHTKLPALKRV